MDPFDFGHEYFYVSHGNVDDTIREMVSQLFLPFVSELRRDLRRTATVNVPASDRIVSLDHNSADYLQLSDALEKVETALREANDYPDAEDKEQRIAEISAARRLLKAPRVRLSAIAATAGAALAYLGQNFIETAVGNIAAKHGKQWSNSFQR